LRQSSNKLKSMETQILAQKKKQNQLQMKKKNFNY